MVDHFLAHDLEFDQVYQYKDVMEVIQDATQDMTSYTSGLSGDLEKYIPKVNIAILSHVVAHGKQLFLITNSPFSFVDMEMYHMVGLDWSTLQ